MPASPTESSIERKIVEHCQKFDVLCYKWVSPSRRGVPDRILIFPDGRVVFAELKTKWGRLSPLQRYEHKRLTEQGATVVVFKTFENYEKWFIQITNRG